MKINEVYVDVAPAVPLAPSDRQLFTYTAPTSVQIGHLVTIPFGPRRVSGVVIEIHHRRPPYPTKEARIIHPDAALTPQQLAFARWIADTMHGGLGYTARLFAPAFAKASAVAKALADKSALPTLHTLAKTVQPNLTPAQPVVMVEAGATKRLQAISELAAAATAQGKQAAIIVPEISLLGPLIAQLAELLPEEQFTTLFSGQPASHVKNVWYGVRQHTISVVVGTQKALFLPWQTLGLLVIEEAFFPTHKLWDQYPRLSTVHAAPHLARLHAAPLLYAGSLTSLHLHHHLQQKTYTAAHLNPLIATVTAVGFDAADRAARHLLPHALLMKLTAWRRDKKRVFILYNKKGAGARPGLKPLHPLMIDASLAAALPPGRVHRASLIVGTQAAFRLLPPASLDYVVWLYPEDSLQFPDARSRETSRYLLTRLAQLAKNHTVVAVSRKPQSTIPELTLPTDELWAQELTTRQRLFYPPIHDMVKLTVRSQGASRAFAQAEKIRLSIEQNIQAKKLPVHIFGPFNALRPRAVAKAYGGVRPKPKQKRVESHILLLGSLEELIPLYRDVSCDSADYMPERVL